MTGARCSNYLIVLVCLLTTLISFYAIFGWWLSIDRSSSHAIKDSQLIRQRLIKNQNVEWWMTVAFGTPKQDFGLRIDTGSSYLWLRSVDCQTNYCRSHRQFIRNSSSTYEKDGRSFEIKLDGMDIVGILGSDSMSFYNLDTLHPNNESSLKKQKFLEAIQLDGSRFSELKSDGNLGLGLQPSLGNGSTLIGSLFASKLIGTEMFSIYMQLDSRKDPDGEILFGGYDRNRFIGELTYAKLTRPDQWQIKVDGIQVEPTKLSAAIAGDGHIMPSICENGCEASVNTSQPYIGGPKAEIDLINEMLKASQHGSGHYKVDCGLEQLHDIVFYINGSRFVLKPKDYIIRWTSIVTYCFTAFVQSPSNDGTWTLGNIFLGNYYTVFDSANKQVGFAPLV